MSFQSYNKLKKRISGNPPVAHHFHPNKLKWLNPPTIEQIEAVYKKLNVSGADFERFYGMPKGMIAKVRRGDKPMPAKYWHLFFEEPEKAPLFEPNNHKPLPESLSKIM